MPDLDAQVQIPEQDFDVPAEVNFGGSDSDDTEPARRDDRPIRDGDGDTESFSMGSLVLAIAGLVLAFVAGFLAWHWTSQNERAIAEKADASRMARALRGKADKSRVEKIDQAVKNSAGDRIDSASLASESALRKKADKSRVDNLESELDSKAEAKRVEKLEGRVDKTEGRLDEVESDVQWLAGETEKNEQGLEELRDRKDDSSGTITIVPASK